MEKEQTAIIEIFVLLYFQLLISFLLFESKSKIKFAILPKKKSHIQSVDRKRLLWYLIIN
jgi:hypothetical protein